MIIGLTGSIASGKSTVSEMLMKKGYPIVDADLIARKVVEPGTKVMQEIESVFGVSVLHEDGSLNREKLGEAIFTNEEKRNQLNEIMHPAIRREMLRQRDAHIEAGEKVVIMDIPLLFESKLQSYVEKILVVTVSKDVQKIRLMKRNHFTEQEAIDRIASQLPLEIKEAGADAVINNDGTLEQTEKQLDTILCKWGINNSDSSEL